MTADQTSQDRPPKPPRRRCPVTGCPNEPRYPSKDWSVFCVAHDDAESAETQAWQRLPAEAGRPELREALAAVVAETRDNERRFLEWWVLGTKGIRFPRTFQFFEWHREATGAAENLLAATTTGEDNHG